MNKVTICIVTWNSSRYIQRCLDCINNQTFRDFELLIIDNNSSDNTLEMVKLTTPNAKIIKSNKNLGFCGGHNLGIKQATGEYYMPYNPDIFAENNFLEEMVNVIERDKKIGAVSGKLLRFDPVSLKKTNVIDSTGVMFKKNRRSIDRGSEEVDKSQYQDMQYVFGASGAAPLFRKEMLEDIKIKDQYFMEYFFAYREDVDLAWRAQHRGWNCIYTPKAIAYHVRTNTPLKRKEMSHFVNMNSVKNRIIMLFHNETRYGLLRDGWLFLGYELLIFIYVVLKERTSLGAYSFIFKNIKNILEVRKHIMSRSKIKEKDLLPWFGRENYKDL